MYRARLAFLAATLCLLRCHPLAQGCSSNSVPSSGQQNLGSCPRTSRRRRPLAYAVGAAANTPVARPLPPAPTTRFIVEIASRKLREPGEFGSHLPHSGRFNSSNKLGRRYPDTDRCGGDSDAKERGRRADEGDDDDAWEAAVAALAASGTVLAYQKRPGKSPSAGGGEGAFGELSQDADGDARRPRPQDQGRHRHPRFHHPNTNRTDVTLQDRQRQPTMAEAAVGESPTLEWLWSNLSSGGRECRQWIGRGGSGDRVDRRPRQWRRAPHSTVAGAPTAAEQSKPAHSPPAQRPQQHTRSWQQMPFSFLVNLPSVRSISKVQTDVFVSAVALYMWASSTSGAVGSAVGGTISAAIDSATRGAHDAQIWIEIWMDRRARELSALREEAGRRAETAFTTVATTEIFGRGIGSTWLDIRRRVRFQEWAAWRMFSDGDDLSGEEIGEGEYEGSRLALLTDRTVQNVVDVVGRDGWEHVATTSGVVVYRQYIALDADGVPLPTTTTASSAKGSGGIARVGVDGYGTEKAHGTATEAVAEGGDVDNNRKAPQFACVKATAILDVPPEVVYRLFADNSRVSEYNEHCREVVDLETLSPDCKITWAASGRMGPFKARDFCTLVHFRTLSDGTLAQVSRPVEHPAAPRSNTYVRSEILLAGNFMRAVPGDPSRTEFMMITHVNPGGAAETRAGAMLVNKLCTSSPVNFIRRLEASAQKLLRELQEAAEDGADGDIIPGGGGSGCGGIAMENDQVREKYTARDLDTAEGAPVPPNPEQQGAQGGDLQGSGGTAWGVPADENGVAAGSDRGKGLEWGATGKGSSAGAGSGQEPVGAAMEPSSGVEDDGGGVCGDSDALGEESLTGGNDEGRTGAARIQEGDALGDGDGCSSSSSDPL